MSEEDTDSASGDFLVALGWVLRGVPCAILGFILGLWIGRFSPESQVLIASVAALAFFLLGAIFGSRVLGWIGELGRRW